MLFSNFLLEDSMAALSSALAGSINLFCTGTYYFCRKPALQSDALLHECSGIAIAAVLNSTRSYTTPYLRQRFNDRQLDCLHGAASVLIIGLASHYAKLPLKTYLTTLIFFAGLHLGVHKLTSHLFRNQLTFEQRNRHRQKSTFQNMNWLRTELFPIRQGYASGNVTAYLYAMPDGFFVFLSESNRLPFFEDRLGSIDPSEVCKIQEEICGTLKLSPEALQKLREEAKRVSFDGAPHIWELEGIPPFICFEGKWNEEHNPLGTPVNWETLILTGLTQKHSSFELTQLPATWTTRTETPGLRGFSFNHTDCRFNIWVHEKNLGALQSELDSLTEEISDFRAILTFCRDFENAAFTFLSTRTFPTTRRGGTDWNALQTWGNLTQQIPFPHLTTRYPNLAEQVRSTQRNLTAVARQALETALEEFFQTLPCEAHFPTDTVMAEMFRNALNAFYSASQDFVRTNGYINCFTLQTWLEMLRRIRHNLGTCVELDELIDLSQEYLNINNQLRNRPLNPELLRQRRTELDPILKERYTWFFKTYERLMSNKGKFAEDLSDEISLREKRQAQLQAIKLCEQGVGGFSVEDYLKTEEGALKLTRLESWTKILEFHSSCSEAQYQQLLGDCQNYQRTYARTQMTEEKRVLIDRIISGFGWFFGTYVPGLQLEAKRDLLEQIAHRIQCPRSHIESTAQIAYYSYLEPFHLHAIIRRNRAYQLSALLSAIDSEVKTVSYADHPLPDEFCDRLNEDCTRACDFMVRKAQHFKILQQSWAYSEEEGLQLEHQAQYSDGSEYQVDPFIGTQVRDAHRHLNQVSEMLANLHTMINQTSEATYLASSFLAEEQEIVTALYRVANELLFLLQVPLRWNLHRQLHEYSVQTKKAERGLVEGRNYSVYKRISDGGLILWDIVRDNETSEIERRNAVHTAIYHQRH